MTAPEVVLFDLDDTLFAHREAVDAGATTALRALDAALDDARVVEEIARWRELEELHYHRYLSGEIGFEEQRRARARGFTSPYGIELDDEAASAWWQDYFTGYREAWVLHGDALPCLDELESRLPGVRFGLITNGELDFQMSKIAAMELEKRLEHIVASGEVGVAKPDQRIFRHACELFDVDPSDAVYVGDRIRTDAIGAAEAGLLGVWLDRRGVELSAQDRADADAAGVLEIPGLADLPALLS